MNSKTAHRSPTAASCTPPSFFRTDQKVYSRTALSYRRSFFDDTVSVRAEFAAHHDGTALGTQQMLVVGVKLLKPFTTARIIKIIWQAKQTKHGRSR